jgi:hypothetical protein
MYNLLVHNGCQTLHHSSAQPLVVCKFSRPGDIEAFAGTVSREFLFRVLSRIIFPQASENNISVILNLSEKSRRYSQVKVHHLYQRQWWQICHRFQLGTPAVNWAQVPLVSLILVATLPQVSTTPVALALLSMNLDFLAKLAAATPWDSSYKGWRNRFLGSLKV